MVNQPFMINSNIPLLADGTPDRTYLAPDCFHFARKTHNGAAVALWNNMLQPVGHKDLQWTLGESVDCPSHKQPCVLHTYSPLGLVVAFFLMYTDFAADSCCPRRYFATWKNSQQ